MHTVQWSSNIKGVQVSPEQDIPEVFFVPLGLYVLSEWRALPSAAMPPEAAPPPPSQTCRESPISRVTGTDPMALSICPRWSKDTVGTGRTASGFYTNEGIHGLLSNFLPQHFLSCTEKLGMSSNAWPRHLASLSCSQRLPTQIMSPESTLLILQGALQQQVWNDSLSLLQSQWPTAHGHIWSTAPPAHVH